MLGDKLFELFQVTWKPNVPPIAWKGSPNVGHETFICGTTLCWFFLHRNVHCNLFGCIAFNPITDNGLSDREVRILKNWRRYSFSREAIYNVLLSISSKKCHDFWGKKISSMQDDWSGGNCCKNIDQKKTGETSGFLGKKKVVGD